MQGQVEVFRAAILEAAFGFGIGPLAAIERASFSQG